MAIEISTVKHLGILTKDYPDVQNWIHFLWSSMVEQSVAVRARATVTALLC